MKELPISTMYKTDPDRPSSIRAQYLEDVAHGMRVFLGKNAKHGCADCGRHGGDTYINPNTNKKQQVVLQASHEFHNPESTQFVVRCAKCHRAHDKTQQTCAATLTLMCEGRLPHIKLCATGALVRADVDQSDIYGLSPSGADLVCICILHKRGPLDIHELAERFRASLRLKAPLGQCLQVVESALVRLSMRETTDGVPLVRDENGPPECSLSNLSLDIEYVPVGEHSHKSSVGRYRGWLRGDQRIYV